MISHWVLNTTQLHHCQVEEMWSIDCKYLIYVWGQNTTLSGGTDGIGKEIWVDTIEDEHRMKSNSEKLLL